MKKPVRKFTAIEASWLAGVIDGEGSIGLYHGKEGRIAIVQMGNTCGPFVEEVKRIIGCGSAVWRTTFTGEHKGRKPIYHFTLKGSKRCLSVLKQIQKFLIVKKRKAIKIINEIESKPFGYWTKARKIACSKRLRKEWANPRIRNRRLRGMRHA